jgi:hypothetical protein
MEAEDKTKIEGFDEVTTYFFIDMIGGILWRTNHDVSHGRYPMTPEMIIELAELREQQEYCVQQLSKFGVDPESAKNRPDGNYWKWFEHWHDWQHGMSNDAWHELDRKMSAKEDITDMLPKHKWNEKPQE